MPALRLTVRTETPLLMFGANNDMKRGEPELRASSIRGILRYWLRALLGASGLNPSELYEQESAILGSTAQGSRVNVRVTSWRKLATDSLSVLPERTSRGYKLQQPGFDADSQFRITLSTHPLDTANLLAADGVLVRAIFLMTHFGGLGRRARRGSGNLTVLQARGYDNDAMPLAFTAKDQSALKDYLQQLCPYVTQQADAIGYRPDYPTFAQDTAIVLIGNRARRSYQDAYQDLWSASGPYHHDGGIFGDVRPRRSSAVHMRVTLTEDGYIPIQTILYTGPGDWQQMQNYINDQLGNGFSHVYGTWEHWT